VVTLAAGLLVRPPEDDARAAFIGSRQRCEIIATARLEGTRYRSGIEPATPAQFRRERAVAALDIERRTRLRSLRMLEGGRESRRAPPPLG
jgi:hypothetical protein